MKNKLIIWDFDGVIADTEVIWLKIRMDAINKKFNLNYDIPSIYKTFGGTNDAMKQKILSDKGYHTDKAFWDNLFQQDIEYIKKYGIELTPGVEDIFKSEKFTQCIATSGGKFKTDMKIEACGIKKYFPDETVFTADNVKVAKPEPDLFLYAAKHMGYTPKNCIVIEDSIAGMIAGIRAGMKVIAFIGNTFCKNDEYINKIKELEIKNIFYNMADIKKYLEKQIIL